MSWFQFIALICVTLFYAIYFAKQIALRENKIQSNRLLRGRKPKRTLVVECFLLVFTFLLALLQYASIFFHADLGGWAPSSLESIVGMMSSVIGICYFLNAVVQMKENWRAGIDETQHTRMVTTGIYGISRNPAFTGFDLLYIGVFFMFPGIILMIFTVITIGLIHFQIIEEEKYLTVVFGDEYLKYKDKVRRYI